MATSTGRLPNELWRLLCSNLDFACYSEVTGPPAESLPQDDVSAFNRAKGEEAAPPPRADAARLVSTCEFGSPNSARSRRRFVLLRLQSLKMLMDDHENVAADFAHGFDRPF